MFEREVESEDNEAGIFHCDGRRRCWPAWRSSSAPAAAKTIKECQKEWQADKVAMQAAGKTEKAYVAECRGKPAASTAATKPPKEDKGGY